MKISIIEPISFCEGVKHALNVLDKAINENPNKKIYVYGEIIHNTFVVRKYVGMGVVFLDKTPDELQNLENDSVIVLPAHGAPQYVYETLNEKGIKYYEAICPFIKENIKEIKKAINDERPIIYIGDKEHDESKAILSLSNNIYLLDKNKLENYYFNTNKSPLIVCQSTLENNSLSSDTNLILSRYPNAENKAKICQTTFNRQKGIINLDDSIDCIIIVGDYASNNTKKLLETAKKYHPDIPSYLVNSFLGLRKEMFINKNHIAIASGASTPQHVIDTVIDFLNQPMMSGIFS